MNPIQTDEEVVFRLIGTGTGLQVTQPDGSIETLQPTTSTPTELLFTDGRILYVEDNASQVREFSYDSLVSVECYTGTGEDRMWFVTDDECEYDFTATANGDDIESAAEYAQSQITEANLSLEFSTVGPIIGKYLIGWVIVAAIALPVYFYSQPGSFEVYLFVVSLGGLYFCWRILDDLEQYTDHIAIEVVKRLLAGLLFAYSGLFASGTLVTVYSIGASLDATTARNILLAGPVIGFLFGVAVGDEFEPIPDF